MRSLPKLLIICPIVLTLIAIGGVFYAAASFRDLRNTLVKEIHKSHEETERLSRNFLQLARDSNEMRSFLGFPVREYELSNPASPAHERGVIQGSPMHAYFNAVEFLIAQAARNERAREFNAVLTDASVEALRLRLMYRERHEPGIVHWERDGNTWFSFYLTESQDFIVRSQRGNHLVSRPSYSFRTAGPGLVSFLETETTALAEHFRTLRQLPAAFRAALREPAFTAALRERELIVESPEETENEISALIRRARGRGAETVRLSLDKRNGVFRIGNQSFAALPAFQSGLLSAVERMDVRTIEEFFVAQGKKQLEELFDDAGFIAYLETRNLVLSREFREDDEFVFFDFLTLDGRRIGSIGIHKRTDGIYLFDDEYVSLGAIQSFRPGGRRISSVTDPQPGAAPAGLFKEEGVLTVLIGGAHQRLTDTLILAKANKKTQAIDLFSLPRDLFFRNLKINLIYYLHGPQRLVREMESMTGFAIDNFIIIDMFAFIDVINILGGIDVTLEAPLFDPTYRVRNNGRWSTLFYPAGTHHLNGIEALRIARSRHFVSDFGRAHHQQLILAAIVERVTSLGLSDIGKVSELALLFLRYVETDFTPNDILRNILRFRNASVRSQTVLNTENILTHNFENLWRNGLTEDEVDEDFNLGSYILLPLDEDWSLIHNFIRSVVEGSA